MIRYINMLGIHTIDVVILVVYIIAVLGIGLYMGKREEASDFFINSGKTKFWLLLFTSLSTSVGAGTLLGVASATSSTGISFGASFIALSVIGWILMAYLAPKIKRIALENNAYTFGDIIAAKLSDRTRKISGVVVLTGYFLFTAIQYIAAAKIIELVFDLNFNIALAISAIATIAYTAMSGIKGDFYTDAIQFFVMLPVFVFVLIKGLSIISITELFATAPEGFLDVYNYAGPVFFYASIIFGFALLVSGMDIWQRVFAAYDEKTAQKAFIYSGVLKVVLIIGSIIIGMLAVHLVPASQGDAVVFDLMYTLLPSGLLGLGLASVLAIVMSTVDSMIMVGSAVITKDFYVRSRDMSQDKILKAGRLSVLGFGLLALVVAYLAPNIVRLSVAAAQIGFVIVPTLLALLFKINLHEKTAFWSILVGFVIILIALPFAPDYAFLPGLTATLVIFFGHHNYLKFKNRKIFVQ